MPHTDPIDLRKYPWPWILATGAVILGFAIYRGFGYPQPLTSDQEQIGLMVLQQVLPENFARDYALSNPVFYGFYTPSFIIPATFFTRLTGSYDRALSIMLIPIATIYLACMTWLLYRVTGSPWLAFGLAVLSCHELEGIIGDQWGPILRIQGVTPRNNFLALVPVFYGSLLLILQRNRSALRFNRLLAWGALGFGLGVMANLHPVSGVPLGVILGGLLGLALIRGDLSIKEAWPLAPAAILAASPMLYTFFSGTEVVPVSSYDFTFEEFYQIGDWRIEQVWPWSIPGGEIPARWLGISEYLLHNVALVGYVVLCTMFGLAVWWLRKAENHAALSLLWKAFLLAQIPVLTFFVDKPGGLWLTAIVVIYLLNLVVRQKEPDWLDKRLMETTVFICSIPFIFMVVQQIWIRYEVWELTLWGTQPVRGARFIHLPVYLLAARQLHTWVRQKEWPVLALAFSLTLASQVIKGWIVQPLIAGAVLLFLMWLIFPERTERPVWARILLVWGSVSWTVLQLIVLIVPSFRFRYQVGLALLLTCLIGGLIYVVQWLVEKQGWKRMQAALAGLAGLLVLSGVGFAILMGTSTGRQWLNSAMAQGVCIVNQALALDQTPYLSDRLRASYELYDWARTATRTDSLFYAESLEFRRNAQRSITHNWKDLAPAFFLRYLLVDYYARLRTFQAAYKDEAVLLQLAEQEKVDYIIIPADKELILDLPVVFENEGYTVYEFPE